MSTFDGRVAEFPDIRIDYFRQPRIPDPASRPVLAYFLSHVHTDHTVGLEACNSPFVYCSPATRAILLRLEKYPHRMNFSKGILETRKQTFRPQTKLLKAIPLETPTIIELAPGRKIRVTLFDANHCIGACMFLIEGDGKAIIYTGDIRSERWWVDSLVRHPILIPYIALPGKTPIKRLDCLYFDSTFVASGKEDSCVQFPSKAEGITEMLEKVAKYPKDTLFYFDSWTFGYEDVWEALSAFLGEQIHVDDYRFGLFKALLNGKDVLARETSRFMGFVCGNHVQKGCLTQQQTRLHSCEWGTGCDIFDKEFVRITPIITRYNGMEIVESGCGGGQGDMDQRHELDVADTALVGQLMALCATRLRDQPEKLATVLNLLSSIISGKVQSLSLEGTLFGDDATQTNNGDAENTNGLSIDRIVFALADLVAKQKKKSEQEEEFPSKPSWNRLRPDGLPKRITFPYSRHASYSELCMLLEAFKPTELFPCTVDHENWTPEASMSFLFGHLYTDDTKFRHDQMMLRLKRGSKQAIRPQPATQTANALKDPIEPVLVGERSQREVAGLERGSSELLGVDSPLYNRKRKFEEEVCQQNPSSILQARTDSDASVTMTTSPDQQHRELVPQVNADLPTSSLPHETGAPVTLPTLIAVSESPGSTTLVAPDTTSTVEIRSEWNFDALNEPVAVPTAEEAPPEEATFERLEAMDLRRALQQEAWDAVLGIGDLRWADIGLVSTGGHQEREEEL